MPYRPNKRCNICKIIAQEGGAEKSTLYKRVQESQVHGRKKPLTEVAGGYDGMQYLALVNHSKRHQSVTEHKLTKDSAKAAVVKARNNAMQRSHNENRGSVTDQLMGMMERGELKGATYTAVLTALKHEADIEAKKTDQALEYAKLFGSYIGNPLPPPAQGGYIDSEIVE